MNTRRKELIEQYKQMKTDMGIFWIRARGGSKCFLEISQNVNGLMNRMKFQLNMGMHVNKELQQEWTRLGEAQFDIETLELIKYDKDESKTDYSEELAILKFVWEEKLANDNFTFYRHKLKNS